MFGLHPQILAAWKFKNLKAFQQIQMTKSKAANLHPYSFIYTIFVRVYIGLENKKKVDEIWTNGTLMELD